MSYLLPLLGMAYIPYIIYHFAMAAVVFLIGRSWGTANSWLAFLPVGQDYALGALADHVGGSDRIFRYGDSYYRHILCVIQIMTIFVMVMSYVLTARGIVLPSLTEIDSVGVLWDLIPFLISAIRAYVLYKIYYYYQPDRASIFALISVFLGFLTPVLLFILYRRGGRR